MSKLMTKILPRQESGRPVGGALTLCPQETLQKELCVYNRALWQSTAPLLNFLFPFIKGFFLLLVECVHRTCHVYTYRNAILFFTPEKNPFGEGTPT